MQKMDGKTRDIVQDNIKKLKELFPEVFTEEKIMWDRLQETLGNYIEKNEKERYEFTWNGKTEAIQMAQKQSTGTLRPCKEESVDWDTTQNLYIEGDNLEVLRLLQNSYRNKVKMIYIDPPYNTGKDFVYKDNFHDNQKVIFVIAGIGPAGTSGAAYYLLTHYKELAKLGEEFGILIQVPSGYQSAKKVNFDEVANYYYRMN